MRITKKTLSWIVGVLVAALFAVALALALQGCSLLGGIDTAAMERYDTNKDGVLSDDEQASASGEVKGWTTDNLPFPFNLLGGLAVTGGVAAYSEWKRRQAAKALSIVANKFTDAEVESDLAPETNPVINKLVEKRRNAKK